jgi:hypothetical protein
MLEADLESAFADHGAVFAARVPERDVDLRPDPFAKCQHVDVLQRLFDDRLVDERDPFVRP